MIKFCRWNHGFLSSCFRVSHELIGFGVFPNSNPYRLRVVNLRGLGTGCQPAVDIYIENMERIKEDRI